MILACIRHKATCHGGRWEYSEKELHELNLVGPVAIADCPKCREEKIKEQEYLRRGY